MSEPSPLHVVVRDLTDALRPERLPAQIFSAVPPAGRTGQPLSLRAGLLLCHSPISPGMLFERARAVLWRCFGGTTIGFGHQTGRSPWRNAGGRIWAREGPIRA